MFRLFVVLHAPLVEEVYLFNLCGFKHISDSLVCIILIMQSENIKMYIV